MRVRVVGSTLDDMIADLVTDEELKTLLDLHGELVMNTPVDTGNARAGWTVNTVAMSVENNVEYIEALNNGHSQQAPAGFVENAMDKVARR